MNFTPEEVQHGLHAAHKMRAEGVILSQWFYALAKAIGSQERTLADLPVFDEDNFLGGDYATASAISEYYETLEVTPVEPIGVDVEGVAAIAVVRKNVAQRDIEFIYSLIGDQLKELGLELEAVRISDNFDFSIRFYLKKSEVAAVT